MLTKRISATRRPESASISEARGAEAMSVPAASSSSSEAIAVPTVPAVMPPIVAEASAPPTSPKKRRRRASYAVSVLDSYGNVRNVK